MQFFGVDAIIRIISHLMFIYISFWALQSLRIEQFFKAQYTSQIRLLLVFFTIALGFTVSSFTLEFIALCRNLFLTQFP
jgi:uncharacterized integral membrane protein (TIGR02327 family)